MKKLTIAVLFGGCSPEYGVSLESASAVIQCIDQSRFTPVPVGISRQGDWYFYWGDPENIARDAWLDAAECAPALILPNRSAPGLLVQRPRGDETLRLDAAFPVLHGQLGEDGTVQALFELAGIPLVGCGVLASALCMDKHRAHQLAQAAGISVPRAFVVRRGAELDEVARRAEGLGYPLFVKPVRAGSSFGVTKVEACAELPSAIENAFQYDDEVIVEECVSGFEVGCAVMGNDRLEVGELDEIELQAEFFTFAEKYTLASSAIHVPARVAPEKSEEIKRAARLIYRALGCRGFARVDMFLSAEGKVLFNEVNSIPGFTAHSRFPSMMKAAGVPFERVITRAIELAVGE